MKRNNFPYHTDEWSQLVEEAFAEDAPQHAFSDRYLQQRQKIQQEAIHRSPRRFHMKRTVTAAVAVAAAVVLVPSAVYASTQIRGYFRPIGTYGGEAVIPKTDSVSDQIMALSVGWMPEDMPVKDEAVHKYGDSATDRNVTILFYKMDNADAAVTEELKNVVSQKSLSCGENTAIYTLEDTAESDGNAFNQNAWISFPDSNYVVRLYATVGVTEGEIAKIAENLSLIPAETETATIWSEESKTEDNSYYPDDTISADGHPILQIGDAVRSVYYDDEIEGDTDFMGNRVTLTVDNVSVQDTFEGIDTDSCGNSADYSAYCNADGTITDDVLTYYRVGDGVNTLNEKIKEETVPQKIVVIRVTYTNTGNVTAENTIAQELVHIQDGAITRDGVANNFTANDGTVEITDAMREIKSDNYHFSLSSEHSLSKNHITLAPGESATATMAYCVDEDKLDGLYLQGDGDFSYGTALISLGDLS